MLTIDQAKAALTEVIENIQVKHADYMLLANSLELLYDGAKENQESRQAMREPDKLTIDDVPDGAMIFCSDVDKGPSQDELREAIAAAKKDPN